MKTKAVPIFVFIILLAILVNIVQFIYSAEIINENFDGSVFPPGGWARNDVVLTTVTTRSVSPPWSVAFTAAERYLFTPFLQKPEVTTFLLYVTGSPSVFTVQVGTSQVVSGIWTTVFSTGGIVGTWQTQTIDLSAYQNIYVRMSRTSGSNTFNLDNVVVTEDTPPGKVTGFTAVPGTNGGEINLSWISPGNDGYVGDLPAGSTFYIQYASWTTVAFSTTTQPPANGYHLYIPTGPVTQGTTAYYTVGGLLESVTYYFCIWTRDNAGNWSDISNIATGYWKPPPPSAPTNFSGIAQSTSSIKWEWSTALGANGYRVYRATSPTTVVAELSSAATFYNETELAINSQYGRYVRAFNNSGFGASSPQATFYTLANPPTAFAVISVTSASISVAWNANGNPSWTTYELQYSTESGFAVITGTSPYTTSLLATLYSLLPDTLYYFRVRASNGDNLGTTFSNVTSTFTLKAPGENYLDLVINEIMYNPSGAETYGEWIELYNRTSADIDLTGWFLKEDNEPLTGIAGEIKNTHLIQGSLIIPASGYVILADSGTYFFNSYSDAPSSATWNIIDTSIDLSNTSDTIFLVTPSFKMISSVTYSNAWNNNREGKSIEKVNPAGSETDISNWGESIHLGGTPGTLNSLSPPPPDTTPPADVTDLNASPGYTGGTIELTWTSPGDDGNEGVIGNGEWVIAKSTDSNYSWDLRDPANIRISTSGISAGFAVSYTLSALSAGVTYYFRLWTADESANYSEISNGATTYARPQTAIVTKDIDSNKDNTLIIFPKLDKEVEIIILAGTFDTSIATVTVTVERSTSICKPDPIKQSHLKGTGVGIEIQVKDKTGNLLLPEKKMKLTFKYTDDEITGMKKENLTLAWFNQTKDEWELLSSTVYPAENKIVAEILHLSLFQIVEQIPAETVDNIFVYPNPCYLSKNQKPTFARLPENAEITIYTISGEKIYSATAGDTGYHIWTPENLASGIYIFVIKDPLTGKKKTGKLAIIK